MSKRWLLVGIVLIHASIVGAEETSLKVPDKLDYKKNVIGYRVADTAIGAFSEFFIFSITYQRFFNQWIGIEVSPSVAYVTADEIDSYWGGGIALGPRISAEGKGAKGWWIEPFFELFWGSGDSLGLVNFEGGWFGFTLAVGYSWLLDNGFYADLGFGMSGRFLEGRLSDFDISSFSVGIHPYIQFVLGYGW